jgi:hypothetical protein
MKTHAFLPALHPLNPVTAPGLGITLCACDHVRATRIASARADPGPLDANKAGKPGLGPRLTAGSKRAGASMSILH